MSNINKNCPLPPVPPRPVSSYISGVTPPIPPRRRDFENCNAVRFNVPSEIAAKGNSDHELVQPIQRLNILTGNTAQSQSNYANNFSSTGQLQHVYEEIPSRSSTSGSYSTEVDGYWSDSTFDTVSDESMMRGMRNQCQLDRLHSTERYSMAPVNTADELLQNEQKYNDNLINGILNFIPLLYHTNLPEGLCGQRSNLFGNVEEIHEFHQDEFLPALQRCHQNVEEIAKCFIHYIETDKFYCYIKYALNRRKADIIFERHRDYFSTNQHELNSFLLQPIQRLPRYKLFMEKFYKEMLKFGNNGDTTTQISTVQKAQQKLSELIDLMNAAVSISDIPQCANEFAATSSFAQSVAGFSRENDLGSKLILKPKGNKVPSRNNPIDLFAQGKFLQTFETEIYDATRYKWYRAKFFIFEKLVIYTEIVKTTFPYRGHYFDSEINYCEDSKRLFIFCLHRGTQEIQMRINKPLVEIMKTMRRQAISHFFNEPQLIDFEASAVEPFTQGTSFVSEPDMENSISMLINSQIRFVQYFRTNYEYYSESQSHLETQLNEFRNICTQMCYLHYDRLLADLSVNVGNISGISTIFLQYVKTEFPPVYGKYLKISYCAAKLIRPRTVSSTFNDVTVLPIDDFIYLCIERLEEFSRFFSTLTENLSEKIVQNVSTDRSLYHQLAVVQIELEKFSQSVSDNYRLLCLHDAVIECGLAVASERAKVRSEQLERTSCRVFICEHGVICVSCRAERQFARRSEHFDDVVFLDKFSGRAQPMRLRKSNKTDDVLCFTFGSTKYKVKFESSHVRERFYGNYMQRYVSIQK